ncbi:CHAP domain-containing protein [Bradyrhizobium ottawaense]|uniref:TIGR02594 family protein n=1 Tax=Bradyrhizobium ottawaense TaxID=931866 RepID=A0ABY0QHK0_9BRAD|nr:CHAP domain-containing protein [Bradyrhizobium ottawaense]SDK47038.1 TIGR02594 family protein [Bradyrhizobium ottawaense]
MRVRIIAGITITTTLVLYRLSSSNRSLAVSAGGVVDRARQFIGATASQVGVRSTLWCSAFLRKITGASGVDDTALSWERRQHIAPQVGAIVTMGRRGGGHVGVVSGFTAKGDPIVISGNNGGRVREAVHSRSSIRSWVSAS